MSTLELQAFEFHGEPLVFRQTSEGWVTTAEQVARGLGYKTPKEVSKIFKRHEEEFKAGESIFVTLTTNAGNVRRVRAFSPRGVLRLALHADTQVAGEFRDFVIDVMEKLRTGQAGMVTREQLTAIVAKAVTQALEANNEAWAKRLAASEVRFDRLLESSDKVIGFCAAAMGHRRVQKARELALKNELKQGQGVIPFEGEANEALNRIRN